MIYISSDHGGFKLKNYLVDYYKNKGIEIEDLGPKELNMDDDYPDFAVQLAKKIDENSEGIGILLCRNGVGMSIAANRFKGVRAALSWDPKQAASSRHDDFSNILVLPADYIDETKAVEITDSWLNAPFGTEERRKRRLDKLDSLLK